MNTRNEEQVTKWFSMVARPVLREGYGYVISNCTNDIEGKQNFWDIHNYFAYGEWIYLL